MAEWTKEERAQAIRDTEEMVMKDSHFEIVAAYNEIAIELACQRNRMIAAAKDAKGCLACEYIAGAYKSLNLAIAACTEGK